MVRSGRFFLVLVITLAALCVWAPAQTATDQLPAAHSKEKIVPPAVLPAPFSTEAPSQEPAFSIEFRPADQMTKSDRALVADAESSIAEQAEMNGLEFEQGNWNYTQVMCPALPNHLFIQYTRNNGTGNVTMFTASIPRVGEGRVRIIPILRRGYSLFSPAPINALTISAFNHIRAEEPGGRSSNWLGNGLCYAALAGAHPRIASPDQELESDGPAPALTATMDVPVKGGEVIRFADAAARPRPMEWTMTFARSGKLISAKHFPSSLITKKPVPKNSVALKSRTVPQEAQN